MRILSDIYGQSPALIGWIIILHRDYTRKLWSAVGGAMWYIAHLPLIWTFVIICHQTLASAPPVRRWLARLPTPWNYVILNGALAGVVAAMTAAISVPAAHLANIYRETSELQLHCL